MIERRTILQALGAASLTAAVAACVPAGGGGTSGVANARSIADFAGTWQGATLIAESNQAISTRLTPSADGGFTIDWTSFEADRSQGAAEGAIVVRNRHLTFAPAVLGIWTAKDADPGETATARVDGDTLFIDLSNPGAKGGPSEQHYQAVLIAADRVELVIDVTSAGGKRAHAVAELTKAA